MQPVAAEPLAPEFWAADTQAMAAGSWGYGHFFKYRYQFYDLLKLVRTAELSERVRTRMGQFIMNDFPAQGRPPGEFIVPLAEG